MKFIDLFSGIGGFHVALAELGHTCVLACELDEELRLLYNRNFGMLPDPDIRFLAEDSVPYHDILCAGFPCQPFSKAGAQNGFTDKVSGDLFQHIVRILTKCRPKYLLLENMPNLKGKTEFAGLRDRSTCVVT